MAYWIRIERKSTSIASSPAISTAAGVSTIAPKESDRLLDSGMCRTASSISGRRPHDDATVVLGRSSSSTRVRRASATARSIEFSSSRTLPRPEILRFILQRRVGQKHAGERQQIVSPSAKRRHAYEKTRGVIFPTERERSRCGSRRGSRRMAKEVRLMRERRNVSAAGARGANSAPRARLKTSVPVFAILAACCCSVRFRSRESRSEA